MNPRSKKRIQIIGPNDLIKTITTDWDNMNYVILSGQKYILRKQSSNTTLTYVLDYHSITIEMTEFNPEFLVIIPLIYSKKDLDEMEFQMEDLASLTTEFITHIIETNQIINAELVLVTYNTIEDGFRLSVDSLEAIMKNHGRIWNIKNIQDFEELVSLL